MTPLQKEANRLDLDWFNALQATADFAGKLPLADRVRLKHVLMEAGAVRSILRSHMHPDEIRRTQG